MRIKEQETRLNFHEYDNDDDDDDCEISLPCVLHPIENKLDPVKITHQPTLKSYFTIILPANKNVHKLLLDVRVQYAYPLIILDIINFIVFNYN